MKPIKFQYDVTPDMRLRSVKEYYWGVLLRGQVPLLGAGLVCSLLLILLTGVSYWSLFDLVAIVLILLICLAHLLIYLKTKSLAMSEFDLVEEKVFHTHVSIDEKAIVLDRGAQKTSVPWSQVNRVIEMKSFLILISGRTPLATIRGEFIDVGTRQFIEEKAASN